MKTLNKILNPCAVDAGGKLKSQVFVNVKYDDGRLSITGVVGPVSSGDAVGGCGQITDTLLDATRTINKGWTPDMIDMLVSVWNEWHLNDMRPGTPRQTEFVAALRSSKNVDYTSACEALAAADLLEDTDMWFDRKRQMVVTPTEAQLKCWGEYVTAHPTSKQKKRPTYLSFREWMDQTYNNPAYTDEVTVSAPYVYGSRWLKQDVPQSVIDTLEALPASTRTPAWV